MVDHDGLQQQSSDRVSSIMAVEVPVTEELGFLPNTAKRLIPLASLASPIIFNAMIKEITELSTIIFVGRCDDVVLIGAATLGNMMCNITGKLSVSCTALSQKVSISGNVRNSAILLSFSTDSPRFIEIVIQ